ncbi:hypothetical protein BH160DRAFT_5803 [Burkholderia sp. H160]|nr:hypothetical protein BH160DRAFT_5803 [Burkholderia sp. H160]
MAIDFEVGTHRRCTLYTRQEYRGNALSNEARHRSYSGVRCLS